MLIPLGSTIRTNQGTITTAEHLPDMKYLRTVLK
jgi:hypothetical protein